MMPCHSILDSPIKRNWDGPQTPNFVWQQTNKKKIENTYLNFTFYFIYKYQIEFIIFLIIAHSKFLKKRD